jgi:hypothetical protein
MTPDNPTNCEDCVSFTRNTKDDYEKWEDPGDPIEWGKCAQNDGRFNVVHRYDWCDQFDRKKIKEIGSDKGTLSDPNGVR